MSASAAVSALAVIGTAIVAASAGYLFRRYEHLREQRIDDYQGLSAAFLDAARSAADLLSVHTQVGWPHDLNPETWNEDQRVGLTRAHGDAWERAAVARRSFDVAAFRVDLVASQDSRGDLERLRAFLEAAAYSGAPWRFDPEGDDCPEREAEPARYRACGGSRASTVRGPGGARAMGEACA